MPPDSPSPLLRRMAGVDAPPAGPAAPADASDLARALATAALRVADGMAGLGLSTGARVVRRLPADAAFAGLDERSLCLMVDPAGHDAQATPAPSAEALAARTGLLAFGPALTDALIEAQTIGHVDGPGRPARRPTRIDAALAQPFARALLEQVGRLLPPDPGEPVPGPLRVGSFVAGPESLGLILTAPVYLRVDLELGLGDGARQGGLSLILPLDAALPPDPATEADPQAAWRQRMDAVVAEAPVRLEAVLPPMRLPLARLLSMKVGDLIPLDATALSRIVLHGGASGVTMAGRRRLPRGAALTARLGQLNGMRAVKIAALPGEAAAAGPDAEAETGFGGGVPGGGGATPPARAVTAEAPDDAGMPAPAEDGPDLPDLPDLPGPPEAPDLPDLP